jgi:hypothetical protein
MQGKGKVKGVNMQALVKVLRKTGVESARRVLPPELHHYLSERILVSSRYPEHDHLELLRALARLMPPSPEPWVVLGARSARGDLTGIYKTHLRVGDPVRSLHSLPALWRNYHDTGDLAVSFPAERQAVARLTRFAAPARELCRINVGYFEELVTLAGGADARGQELGCVLQGAPECSWSVVWS